MKTYTGTRSAAQTQVTVDGWPLNPRLDLWNHSPTGFEWGYAGSGPAQLALALLADCLADDQLAVELHQSFKFAVVAGLQREGWVSTEAQIRRVVTVAFTC